MSRDKGGNYLIVILIIVSFYLFISNQLSFSVYGKKLLDACESIKTITIMTGNEKQRISIYPEGKYCSMLVYGKDYRLFNKKEMKELLESIEPLDLRLEYEYKNNQIDEIKVYLLNNKDFSNYQYVLEKDHVYYSGVVNEKLINEFLLNEK